MGWLLSDSFAEYLEAHAPVSPIVEGWIEEVPAETQSDE